MHQAGQRTSELDGEVRERNEIISRSQSALQRTSEQMQAAAADSDSRLHAALEVASSLASHSPPYRPVVTHGDPWLPP